MAQSVEQLIRNQQVRGSNPLISSISSRTFTVRDDFLCGNFLPRSQNFTLPRPAYTFSAPTVSACFILAFRKTNLSFPMRRHLLSSYNQIFTPRFRSSQLRFNPCRLFTAYFVKYLALIGFPYPSAPTDAIYDRVCYSAVKITGLAFRVMSIIYTKAAARRNKSGGIIWKTKQNKASKNLSKRICL